jgi:hypothetical protein
VKLGCLGYPVTDDYPLFDGPPHYLGCDAVTLRKESGGDGLIFAEEAKQYVLRGDHG